MGLGRKLSTVRSLGVAGVARFVAARFRSFVYMRVVVIVYGLEPTALRAVDPRLDPGETWSLSVTAVGGGAPEPPGLRQTQPGLFALVAADSTARHLYRIFVNRTLAGYGFAVRGVRDWPLSETGRRLALGELDALLYGFHVFPDFRGRKLYQTLLARIAEDAFRDGARRVQVYCLDSNTPSRVAIERVGFKPLESQRGLRGLGVRA